MPANPKVTVGPVVGKVTDSTARVLVEINQDKKLTARLTAADGTSKQKTRSFKKDRPAVFQFSGLSAESEYTLSIASVALDVECRVRTLPTNPTRFNVGAVSCNYLPRRGSSELWADLRDRYVMPEGSGHLDLLLHLGDQVYQDETFAKALSILDGASTATPSQERKILELYRSIYRMTWAGYRPLREVLANVPNLMIWDDHEITDDWGSDPSHSKPSPEFCVGTLGRRVYREYQRQLWDDFDPEEDPADGLEHHKHRWGPVGVLFVDQRGGRSFGRDASRPYLSVPQWEDISSALGDGGYFANVRALLVVTSVPLAYLGDAISKIGSTFVNDLEDHWAWGPHRKEQIEMVRALRRWKQGSPEGRELLVLGGDVHVGGRTEILHNENVVFRQLITSPVSNKPPGPILFWGLRGLLEVDDGLGGSYRFEHDDFTRTRNYGIVLIRVPPSGESPRVDGQLVEDV